MSAVPGIVKFIFVSSSQSELLIILQKFTEPLVFPKFIPIIIYIHLLTSTFSYVGHVRHQLSYSKTTSLITNCITKLPIINW